MLTIKYIKLFGFVCPHCKRTFFRNFYEKLQSGPGRYEFKIPDYILEDRALIKCPEELELDLATGKKRVKSGCGGTFKWSQRKIPKWDPRVYIAYDNQDVIDKIFSLPMYSPLICISGNSKLIIKDKLGIREEIISKLCNKKDFEILSYNEKTKSFEFQKTQGCVMTCKNAEVFELELFNGFKIIATGNHKFLTKKGYKELKDLNWKDNVLLNTTEKYCLVKSIKKLKYKRKVYDIIGVKDNNNFVANGMVVHNCDEAIKFASGMEHQRAESKELKKIFAVIRPKRLMIFFNVPSFSWIDSKYRENMSSFWFRCLERGTCVIFEKSKGEGADAYHVKELQEILGPIKFFTDMDKIKRNIRRHPCFFTMFKYGALPQHIYDEYEYVRNAVNLQRKVEEEDLSQKDISKIMLFNLVEKFELLMARVSKSKQRKLTYEMITEYLTVNPVTKARIVSESTLKDWMAGIRKYVASKGKQLGAFNDLGARKLLKDEEAAAEQAKVEPEPESEEFQPRI